MVTLEQLVPISILLCTLALLLPKPTNLLRLKHAHAEMLAPVACFIALVILSIYIYGIVELFYIVGAILCLWAAIFALAMDRKYLFYMIFAFLLIIPTLLFVGADTVGDLTISVLFVMLVFVAIKDSCEKRVVS